MTVYSNERTGSIVQNELPPSIPRDTRVAMDGLDFLAQLPDASIAATFFDPQYRGVLDKLSYGNEGVLRGQKRSALPQMSSDTIAQFIRAIHRVLGPSGPPIPLDRQIPPLLRHRRLDPRHHTRNR